MTMLMNFQQVEDCLPKYLGASVLSSLACTYHYVATVRFTDPSSSLANWFQLARALPICLYAAKRRRGGKQNAAAAALEVHGSMMTQAMEEQGSAVRKHQEELQKNTFQQQKALLQMDNENKLQMMTMLVNAIAKINPDHASSLSSNCCQSWTNAWSISALCEH